MPSAFADIEFGKIELDSTGFDFEKLASVKGCYEKYYTGERYRVIVVYGGRIVADWQRGFDPAKHWLFKAPIMYRLLQALRKNVASSLS